MADVMTFEEHRGPIAGQTIAWVGDGNNVARTFIQAAARFGFRLRLATPPELAPPADLIAWARAEGAEVILTTDPEEAVAGARAVVTDAWVSMSDEGKEETAARHNLLAPYRVTPALMAKAAADAIFLHCLPAHRGEEVAAEVIDGRRAWCSTRRRTACTRRRASCSGRWAPPEATLAPGKAAGGGGAGHAGGGPCLCPTTHPGPPPEAWRCLSGWRRAGRGAAAKACGQAREALCRRPSAPPSGVATLPLRRPPPGR